MITIVMTKRQSLVEPLELERTIRLQGLDPKERPEIERGFNSGVSILAELGEALDQTDNNANLTDLGKRAEAIKAAATARERIAKELRQDALDKIAARRKTEEAQLLRASAPQAPTDPAERIGYEERAKELRADLRALDPLEREALVISSSHPMLAAAIEDAWTIERRDGLLDVHPLVKPEVIAASRAARVRATNPAGADKLERTIRFENFYTNLIAQLERAIRGVVPGEPAAPIVS